MGVGKTPQALRAAEGRTLAIVPAILAGQWRAEADRFTPDLDLTITSYHSLVAKERTAKGGSRFLPVPSVDFLCPWDTVIVDECHNIKERKTTWTKALPLVPADRLWLMSGTPVPNWAHELYVPLKLMHDKGDRQYSSYWRWIRHWFKTWDPVWGGITIEDLLDKWSWQDFIEGNHLDQLVLRRERDDVLTELPPIDQQTIWLDMTPYQRRAYNAMKKTCMVDLEESGDLVVAMNEGSAATQLYKLTTGTAALDPTESVKGSCKLKALQELMEPRLAAGCQTVIFTYYRHSADATNAALPVGCAATVHGGVPMSERRASIARFQAGELPVLVGTLHTIREGLNLQNADCAILVEHSPRAIDNDQAIGRIHRMGQTRPCTVIHLATRQSLDEGLRTKLDRKRSSAKGAIPVAEFRKLV